MKTFIRTIALLLLAPLVFGDVMKTFQMDAPVQRENLDPLPLNQIASYKVECGTTAGGPYNFFTMMNEATGQATESFSTGEIFPEGTYFCIATDTDTIGLESAGSNEVNFTVGRCAVSDCRPKPPVLTVTM